MGLMTCFLFIIQIYSERYKALRFVYTINQTAENKVKSMMVKYFGSGELKKIILIINLHSRLQGFTMFELVECAYQISKIDFSYVLFPK